jgi:hypothetical protein
VKVDAGDPVGFADKQTQLGIGNVDIHDVPEPSGFGSLSDSGVVDWCGKNNAAA